MGKSLVRVRLLIDDFEEEGNLGGTIFGVLIVYVDEMFLGII